MSGLGKVTLTREGFVGSVVFDRPAARNAMTWKMYDDLENICAQLHDDTNLRAVILRGAGGQSFIAGSDIAQFNEFKDGRDGVAYEAKMDLHIEQLLAIPTPTLAVVEGWAVGGGLNIAAACDFRIATTGTKIGSPIARTVGNCLSMDNYARAVMAFGEPRAKRMLMLGEFIDADEAMSCGFFLRVVEPDALDAEITRTVDRLVSNAPLTLRATKEAMRRNRTAHPGSGADIITDVYGSDDFKLGISSFMKKEKPDWTGR